MAEEQNPLSKYRNVDINVADIDGELMRQGSMCLHVGEMYYKAVQEYEQAKDSLARNEAELGITIRKSAIEEGTKITEKGLNELIMVDSNMKNMTRSVLDARLKRDFLKNLYARWQDRIKLLDNFCTLRKAELFALNRDSYKDDEFIPQEIPSEVVDQALGGDTV